MLLTNYSFGQTSLWLDASYSGAPFGQPEIRFGQQYGPNTGLIKWDNSQLGIFTWADAHPIQIGGTLVTFQRENTGATNVHMTGKLGVGLTPSTYKFDVSGNSRMVGNTYMSGKLGVNVASPSCALDIQQGSSAPNVLKIVGSNSNALADIRCHNGTGVNPSPAKTGLFINRRDLDDNTTSGAEILGHRYGIIVDAQQAGATDATGAEIEALTVEGDAVGILVDSRGGNSTIGIDANAGHAYSTNTTGLRTYAWTAVASPNSLYGIRSDISSSYWGVANCYAGYFRGDVYVNGDVSAVSFTTLSDKKFKSDIENFDNGLDIIKNLRPTTYKFKKDEYAFMNLPKEKQYGFIAQELENILPEVVQKMVINDDQDKQFDFKSVNYIQLIPILTKAIQEQQAQIEAQQKQIDELLANNNNHTQTGFNNNSNNTYFLEQNAPNPFTNSTSIHYKLRETKQNTAIGVYDMNGKEVKLFNLNTLEGTITIDGGSMPAGMYLYSLLVDGTPVATKKMILTSK